MAKRASLTNSMEDYLEAISIIGEKKKYVRVKDIAREMQVKMPSVTGALKSLAQKDLVTHEKYEYVELTEQGIMIARGVRRRHDTVLKFLTEVLNIDPETAERDACGIEHAVSSITLDRLMKMMDCFKECTEGVPNCMQRFERYVGDSERADG